MKGCPQPIGTNRLASSGQLPRTAWIGQVQDLSFTNCTDERQLMVSKRDT